MKTFTILTGLPESTVLSDYWNSAFEDLKWIFCFVPFMFHGFIKSTQLSISIVSNSKPVEIFNY